MYQWNNLIVFTTAMKKWSDEDKQRSDLRINVFASIIILFGDNNSALHYPQTNKMTAML